MRSELIDLSAVPSSQFDESGFSIMAISHGGKRRVAVVMEDSEEVISGKVARGEALKAYFIRSYEDADEVVSVIYECAKVAFGPRKQDA